SGTNSITFGGPVTIINAAAGGSRTLGNLITTAGQSVTFGATPGSSTLTVGNPVANGGDGLGKNLIWSPNSGSTFVGNAVIQDPGTGAGSGATVTYAGQANGVIILAAQNTYTGPSMLNGNSTIQIKSDSNLAGTAGPFGAGTIFPNNSSNNSLRPVGGNRTVANPITMTFGFAVTNEGADTSSLTLTGPIALQAT